MTLRSRPVLDRKHRPRWQDELRTQQLMIIGFAVAIAIALGIFGAAAWNGWWETHLRPVAAVAGSTYTRSDLVDRERILTAEGVAEARELGAQLSGGPWDQLLQQQIDSIELGLNSLPTRATESVVESAVLASRADEFGLQVTDADIDAAVEQRFTLPTRIAAQLILVNPLPDDAEAEDEPTDEQLAAARDEAQEALDRVEDGEAFGTVASEVSDDFTASIGGILGWFDAESAYDEYFELLADAEVDELVGPVEVEGGYAVLQLVARRDETQEGGLRDELASQGVSEDTYRAYLRDELLLEEYRAHFEDEVVDSPAAQRRVAEIFIEPVTGTAVPQVRARHILVQPLPDADDQSEATDEEWEAALETAREVEELARADDADWFELAEGYSHDPGSASTGGDLGWYDPANSPFVTEFTATLANMEVGEVSDPIRTDFGWHVIEKTGERESPQAQAAELVEQLRDNPDSFAAVAEQVSEDHESAVEGGEIGWVAPYQLDLMREEAIMGLAEVGEISDPVENAAGISIYQLLETSDSREIEEERLDQIRSSGFERWLDEEVRSGVETWIDPQFASSTAA